MMASNASARLLFSACLLLVFTAAAGQTGVAQECLDCLCSALSGCNKTAGCHVVAPLQQEHCGQFDLNEDAWLSSSRPVVRGANSTRPGHPDEWKECLNDDACSMETAQNIIKSNERDCNGDGLVNCLDHGLALMLGSKCEDAESRGIVVREPYHVKFRRCATRFIKSQTTSAPPTTTTPSPIERRPTRHVSIATPRPAPLTTTRAPPRRSGSEGNTSTDVWCIARKGKSARKQNQVRCISKPGELPRSKVNKYIETVEAAERKRDELENQLERRGPRLQKGSAAYKHARMHAATPEFQNIINSSQRLAAARTLLKLGEVWDFKPRTPLEGNGAHVEPICPATPTCQQHDRYRSMDGKCNNEQNPSRGSAGTTYRRALPPAYGDELSSLRKAKSGRDLPSARLVSYFLETLKTPEQHTNSTVMLAVWGRFIHADMFHTPVSQVKHKFSISCCPDERSAHVLHPDCAPIAVPREDPFFGGHNQTCMEFVRSAEVVSTDCGALPRQQMSMTSAFLDGSLIYGSTEQEASQLRTFNEGLMAPRSDDAGDGRVNQDALLALLATVWLRRHNQIASKLKGINSKWDDEKLYQETRKIIGAEIQHITYKEYLPLLLGNMDDLLPRPDGDSNGYNGSVDPTINNHFASATAHFIDSLFKSNLEHVSAFGTRTNRLLADVLQSHSLLRDSTDDLIRGLITQNVTKTDVAFTNELTNYHLAARTGAALDAVALQLQRGRDHGLPPYVRWRRHCRPGHTISSFADLEGITIPIERLGRLYEDVEDVELLVGLLMERPLEGALVGPTLRCLLAQQFSALKDGDRFFYEHRGASPAFSLPQLTQLRRSSLARVLCESSGVQTMQPRVMTTPQPLLNKRVPCERHDALDLSAWRE